MAGTIKLDLDLIGNLASRLHGDFEHVASSAADYKTGVGSMTITSAIDVFAGNWDIRRGRLQESIKAVAEMAESARDLAVPGRDRCRGRPSLAVPLGLLDHHRHRDRRSPFGVRCR
ncbi:hypothetical protein [Curtobacterium sp. NPDC089689]|uniref:hypothetical protein n=1 Tax=Curtobacterium sp. NPDC089689 TaxID=3363968 RepID=UPI0037FE837C